MDALQRAIDLFDGQAGLARELGISQPAVANWIARKTIPPDKAVAIEKATAGRVTRSELCPELFGDMAPRRRRTRAA